MCIAGVCTLGYQLLKCPDAFAERTVTLCHLFVLRKPREEHRRSAGDNCRGCLVTADASLAVDALSANLASLLAVGADHRRDAQAVRSHVSAKGGARLRDLHRFRLRVQTAGRR